MNPVIIVTVIVIIVIIVIIITTLIITQNNSDNSTENTGIISSNSIDVGTFIQAEQNLEHDPVAKFLNRNDRGESDVIVATGDQLVKDDNYIVSRGIKITDISRSGCYDGSIGLYNMSVRKTPNGYSGTIRGSSCNGCCPHNNFPFYSYAYYIDLRNDGSVRNLSLIDLGYDRFNQCINDDGTLRANGIEDPRIFMLNNEEWIMGNSLGLPQQSYPCINAMCIFKVSDPKSTFRILIPPKGVNLDQRQKNWSPFEYNGELYCEYSIEPHVILKIDTQTGVTEEKWRTGSHSQDITSDASLRGGAPPILIGPKTGSFSKRQNVDVIEGKNNALPKLFYLGVGHVRTKNTSDYLHFFYVFEPKPPFKMIKITSQFKLDGNERIQFAAGLSYDNDMVYISYGVDDCHNRISQFYISDILSIMK
jgi:hypothetical protein